MSVKIVLVTAILLAVLLPSQAWLFFDSSSESQEAEGDIDEECIRKTEIGDCHFYTCFDERHACETQNYALSYGWRYCSRFENHYSRFSREGKNWINATRICAMTTMLEFYRAEQINCGDVESRMKRVHADCEVENGICNIDMMMDNKEIIHDIYYDRFSYRAMVRLLYTVKRCGQSGMRVFVNWLLEQTGEGLSVFSQLLEQIGELDMELPF